MCLKNLRTPSPFPRKERKFEDLMNLIFNVFNEFYVKSSQKYAREINEGKRENYTCNNK